jgi:hypothetical protein
VDKIGWHVDFSAIRQFQAGFDRSMEQQKQHNNDGDRDAQQPKKNSATHGFLQYNAISSGLVSGTQINPPDCRLIFELEEKFSVQAAVRSLGWL